MSNDEIMDRVDEGVKLFLPDLLSVIPIRGRRVRVLAGIALEQQRRRARLARQETKAKNRAAKQARRKNRKR